MNYGDVKTAKVLNKNMWSVTYKGTDGVIEDVEVIARSYESLNKWILRHVWCNTVTNVTLKQTIQEIGE